MWTLMNNKSVEIISRSSSQQIPSTTQVPGPAAVEQGRPVWMHGVWMKLSRWHTLLFSISLKQPVFARQHTVDETHTPAFSSVPHDMHCKEIQFKYQSAELSKFQIFLTFGGVHKMEKWKVTSVENSECYWHGEGVIKMSSERLQWEQCNVI